MDFIGMVRCALYVPSGCMAVLLMYRSRVCFFV